MNKKDKTIGVAIFSLFEKIFGFLKSILFSYLFGTSYLSDAFNVTLSVSDTLYSISNSGIVSSYIPLASEVKESEKDKYTSGVINFSIITLSIISIIALFFSKSLAKIFAPGFTDDVSSLTSLLIKISIFSIVFIGISNLLISYLQSKKHFIVASISPLILNGVECFAIVLSFFFGSIVLSIGILVGSFIQLMFLFIYCQKNGYRYNFAVLNRREVKTILKISLPIILSASVARINVIVDKAIASGVVEGGISALSYSDNIIIFLKALFAIPVITTVFPLLTESAVNNDQKTINELVSESIKKILFYILPITFGLILLSDNFIEIIYMRGNFDSSSLKMTSACLKFYAIGLPAYCIRDLLVKIYYSKKNSVIPTINLFVGVSVNVGLNFLLIKPFGISGLALASAISGYITVFLLFVMLLCKKDLSFNIKTILCFCKIAFSSLLMFISLYLISSIFVLDSVLLYTVLLIFIGFIVYVLFLSILKTFESKKEFCNKILMK